MAGQGSTVSGNSLVASNVKKRRITATGQWTEKMPVDMNPGFALSRRALGRTGLQVSVLGFGTAPLGDLYVQLDDGTAIDTVKRAFELGINLLDTSPLYGNGLAEHRCGAAIRRVPRQDIVVCTKVGRWMDPFHGRGDGSGFSGGQPHRAVIRTRRRRFWPRWHGSSVSVLPMASRCPRRRCISPWPIRLSPAWCWGPKRRRRSSTTWPHCPLRCRWRFGAICAERLLDSDAPVPAVAD